MESELWIPPCPPCLLYLVNMFWRIRRRKGSTGFGPAAIEWPDLDAFARFSGIHLTQFELEMIEMLDDLFLSQSSKPASSGDKDK